MQFVRVEKLAQAVQPLQDYLVEHLAAGRTVLWLVSGGSNVELSVQIMRGVSAEQSKSLTIMLMDERYGVPGHADSNDQKLTAAGFDPKQANWIHVLQEGLSHEQTTAQFADTAMRAFADADVVVGQFGMGADGHTAGILPGSPPVTSADFACGFAWSDFVRITLTPHALAGVTTAFLVAGGADKRPQLERLQAQDLPVAEQPVQLLKQLPECFVYNDQLGAVADIRDDSNNQNGGNV